MSQAPTNQHSTSRLSFVVEQIIARCRVGEMTIGEMLHEMTKFGHLIVCLIFCLPFLLPIPLPGLSTVFGFIVAFAAVQDLLNIDPWLPRSWRRQKVPSFVLDKILYGLDRLLLKSEKLIKPRMIGFAGHRWVLKWNSFLILVLAILLSLPMPPGFNAPPAIAIIVLALSCIERDGLSMIIGYVLSALNALLFGVIFFYGIAGLKELLGIMS